MAQILTTSGFNYITLSCSHLFCWLGCVTQKSDFNEKPVVELEFDFDFWFVNGRMHRNNDHFSQNNDHHGFVLTSHQKICNFLVKNITN